MLIYLNIKVIVVIDKNSVEEQESATVKKNMIIKILIAIIVLILIAIGAYIYLSKNNILTYHISNQNFNFKTARNREFHIKTSKNRILIEELKGKILFLKVFSWNCHYCQKEIPELIKLKNKFKNAFDTVAIEIEHHSDQENLEFIKKYNINYNIVNGDNQLKFLDYLREEYRWNGVIPLTIVIDAEGRVLAFEVGYKSYSLTTLLQTTLKQLTTVAQ